MVIDLSIPLHNDMKMLDVFPACEISDYFSYESTKERYLQPCHGCKTTLIAMVDHTGTHVDSPAHFIKGGKDVSQLPVDAYMGDAIYIDMSDKADETPISKELLTSALEKIKFAKSGKILLIKCSKKRWNEDGFLEVNTLTEEAADLIIEYGFKAVGIDCMCVDCMSDMRRPVHMKLLSKDIVIVEGLANMEQISNTQCQFIALPLKLQNASGSPVRAICIV